MRRKSESRISSDRGSSLLVFLEGRFTYLDTAGWRERIADGSITVNGEVAEAEIILREGDLVAFDSSGIAEPEVDSRVETVMEDEDFLVVEKCGSLPCHPGGRFFEHSLWFILRERYGWIHIATRLDRETSGLVLVCKNPAAVRRAQAMHEAGTLRKGYLAMVHGAFPESLRARGFLVPDDRSAIRKKRRYIEYARFANEAEAEACDTLFELRSVIATDSGPISLVGARPVTGRTHQIRAILLSSGFPVVGDKLYGLDELMFRRFAEGCLTEEDSARLILPCQALHCAELAFPGPAGLEIVSSSEPRWGPPYPSFPGGRTRP
jgi:RluA family pseudouridine synthase